MFARVTFSQISPDKVDEALETFRAALVPAAGRQPGFKRYIGLYDRASGKAITVTVWETEADRQASSQQSDYYRDVIAKVAPFFTSAPVVEDYEAEVF